jgi:hypothetical protein
MTMTRQAATLMPDIAAKTAPTTIPAVAPSSVRWQDRSAEQIVVEEVDESEKATELAPLQ